MDDWLTKIKHARRVSVPLLAINTPDAASTVRTIAKELGSNGVTVPIIQWDMARGVLPVNNEGRTAADAVGGEETIGQPGVLLGNAPNTPDNTIIFIHNAGLYWNLSPVFGQGIANLRDLFKQNRRMLVLLGSTVQLPDYLKDDVVVIDEPLPDETRLIEVVKVCDQSRVDKGLEPLPTEEVTQAVEAVRGLNAFAAEQAVAMALRSGGIDHDHLLENKRKQVALTKGLSVWDGDEDFNSVRGLGFIKEFFGRIIHGRKKPNAVIWIDEAEKMFAGGSGGDTSGVSQGILGVMLTEMQNQNARGLLLVGSPGSGKSAISKAVGKEAGIPTVAWDSNSMKESLVGASEANVRNALKVISAISNNNALWIATCNSVQNIPTALRRRFSYGTYFFDLPSESEREAIWQYYIKKYELEPSQIRTLPDDSNWTGAEIRTCCDLAWNLDCTTIEASRYFVPVAVAAPKELELLRNEAENRYLSANNGELYSRSSKNTRDIGFDN